MTDAFFHAAVDEARLGLSEGGVPIGSVLVVDGVIVGRGHNQRVQQGSVVLHAEMAALEDAGRLSVRRCSTAFPGSWSVRTGRSSGARTCSPRRGSWSRSWTTPGASS